MSVKQGLSDKVGHLNLEDGDDDEVEDCLVIGIDFGTTYSGVAWATQVDFQRDQVNFIHSWPGNGRDEGKVPTQIWYGDNEEIAWGYDVPIDAEPFQWFKLLLLHIQDLSPDIRDSKLLARAREMMEKSSKTAVDLIADYLRLLWEHAMSTISRELSEIVVEALAIHVVVTVPAIWQGYARHAMEEAVKKAGILDDRLAGTTKLTLAPEPEAAALATLYEKGSGVKRGNVYVICDAGGGTVDLISYRVNRTKPMILGEAVEGTGGLCGGMFIDEVFKNMCMGRLGSKSKQLSNAGISEIMKGQWEYGIKPQFKPGKGGKEYPVSLPAEVFSQGNFRLNDTKREPHIKGGRIYFTENDIKKTFEAVFPEIEKLVEGQIRMVTNKGLPVTGIILVGGLGTSQYLCDHLKAVYSKAGISVLQSSGRKPRTAICHGAVMKGFLEEPNPHNATAPIMIASTVSRASYGISCCDLFDPLQHLEEDKFWDHHVTEWQAKNQMTWYLTRGQVVAKIKPVRFSWSRYYEEGEYYGTTSERIFQCYDEVPPTRKTSNVQSLGTLKCNLDVGYSDLHDFINKRGEWVKVLKYEIEMVPSGASVEFVLYIDGRRQGSESVNISFG
ncbi:hypothetical protein ANO14919_081600 [Xylariales sp. No.14919]|nr:hypothetical protein ANO14919_081600 [Xylariales sp. No.14919]